MMKMKLPFLAKEISAQRQKGHKGRRVYVFSLCPLCLCGEFCSSSQRTTSQHQFDHLRPAVESQWLFARQAAHDVQQGRRLIEQPAIVAPAIETGHEYRADQGESDLPAVIMAR